MTVGMPSAGRPVRILHLQEGDFRFASRVLKQAVWAVESGVASEVTLLGNVSEGLPKTESPAKGVRICRTVPYPLGVFRGPIPALWRMLVRSLRMAAQGMRIDCDIIHCHSYPALPAAAVLSILKRVPLIYDAHELESQAGQKRSVARLASLIEHALIRVADGVMCVSGRIADWYQAEYRIARPTVVRNVPVRKHVEAASGVSLRHLAGIADEGTIFLYQGALSHGRRIEQLIRVFEGLAPDLHLVFMGYGVLQPMVEQAAVRRPNIHFVPAVPPSEVLAVTKTADVGVCGVENICLSYFYSLPNKLFEFLLAGIPVIAPDYPEMREVIAPPKLGLVVGETDEEWRQACITVAEMDLQSLRERVRTTAAALSWDEEAHRMAALYRAALMRNRARQD